MSPLEQPSDPGNELPIEISFGFVRREVRSLTVAMTVSVSLDQPYSASATYAADFKMEGDHDEQTATEGWNTFARKVVPAVLYPMVRELLMNLTLRARGRALALPLIAFRDFSEIKVPGPQQQEANPSG